MYRSFSTRCETGVASIKTNAFLFSFLFPPGRPHNKSNELDECNTHKTNNTRGTSGSEYEYAAEMNGKEATHTFPHGGKQLPSGSPSDPDVLLVAFVATTMSAL